MSLPILDATQLPVVNSPRGGATEKIDGRITLVQLPRVAPSLSYSMTIGFPLGLGYIASSLERAGAEVTVVDSLGEGIDQFVVDGDFTICGLSDEETLRRIPEDSQIIGVTCMYSQEWPWHREIINKIHARFPNALLVAGGEHISSLPEFSMRECPGISLCVIGEGEETICELLSLRAKNQDWRKVRGIIYKENGQFIKTPPRPRIRDVDQIPWPAWHLFPVEKYHRSGESTGVNQGQTIMPMFGTRGCPYECTFCTNPYMYGRSYYTRNPNDVLDEIEHYMKKYGANDFHFYDLTFLTKRSWVIEFCREIERRKLKFTFQLPAGTRSEIINDELVAGLYKSGCLMVSYAPESGDKEVLAKIKKQVDLKHLEEAVRASLRNKLKVRVHIVLGFPFETRKQIFRTMMMAWKMAAIGVCDTIVSVYMPFPGGELFGQLREDGSIPAIDDDYLKSLNVATPLSRTNYSKHLSASELVAWRLSIYATFLVIQYLVRPWRFYSLLREMWTAKYMTYHSQYFGKMVRYAFGFSKDKALKDRITVTADSPSNAVTT